MSSPGNRRQRSTDLSAVCPSPSAFLCYRRADEPFAAALLGVALGERFGAGNVFLDTLSLRSRRRFERELMARARAAAVLLVIVGARWDRGTNRERLDEPGDWVRTEIEQAQTAGARIVVVLVERRGRPIEPPAALGFLRDCDTVHLDRAEIADAVRAVAGFVSGGAAAALSAGPALDEDTVERAALAMVRHVLPGPQRSMDNDRTIARAAAAALGPGEWLRFAGAGRSSTRRPRGSGIVLLIDDEVRLVELGESPGLLDRRIRVLGVTGRPLGSGTTVAVVPARLLGRERADVHVTAPGRPPLVVLGMLPESARLLGALADPAGDEPGAPLTTS